MKSTIGRFTSMGQVFLALLGITCVIPAQAGYKFTSIDFPGANAGFTQVLGINSEGTLVGSASVDGINTIGFVYNSRTKVFTVLPNVPGLDTSAIGINAKGVVVGNAVPIDSVGNQTGTEVGTILDKGAFTLFSNPGSVSSLSFTIGRAISDSGVVTGYADTNAGTTVSGFIYNPRRDTFIDFLPSPETIAQGINRHGDVVGSVFLPAGGAYAGSPQARYGFVRDRSGSIALFSVNSGGTRARGLTDSGRITGFFTDPVSGINRTFVTRLAKRPGFQALTIPDDKLLDFPSPGEIATNAEGVTEDGVVVGIWIDATGANHGFLAVPLDE